MVAESTRFDWDDGNRAKCRKHGVSIAEVEGLFAGVLFIEPDVAHSGREQRFRAVGRTVSGRSVFVVFTMRQQGDRQLIRPISARFMHRKEVVIYEKAVPRL
jgi:uncharacterized protein